MATTARRALAMTLSHGSTCVTSQATICKRNNRLHICSSIHISPTCAAFRTLPILLVSLKYLQDPRIKFAQEVLDSQLALSEEWISIHAQSAELPEEDFVMLEHCGRCYPICTEFNVPSYRKWLYANDFQEMKNAYRFHKRFLQHLQYQRVADRWLLKMPFHLFTLDALFETYPDARIIFMHR